MTAADTSREMREIEFRLARVDADIARSSYSARRVASLRRQKTTDQARLATLTTLLGSQVQEEGR